MSCINTRKQRNIDTYGKKDAIGNLVKEQFKSGVVVKKERKIEVPMINIHSLKGRKSNSIGMTNQLETQVRIQNEEQKNFPLGLKNNGGHIRDNDTIPLGITKVHDDGKKLLKREKKAGC